MKPGAKIGSAPGLGFRLSYDTNCRIKVLTIALNGNSMNTAARIRKHAVPPVAASWRQRC